MQCPFDMKFQWPLPRRTLEICTALSFLFAVPHLTLAAPLEREPCAEALMHNLERFGTAWDEVQLTSVASGLVLRRFDLHGERVTEFMRLQLRSIKGTYWELAIYAAPARERAAVAQKVRRWSWDPYAFGIMDVAPELFLGPRKLKKLAGRMEGHPHLAELIRHHGSFAFLRQPLEDAKRLELAEKFQDDSAYFAATKKLEEIETELARRHLTSEDLQVLVTRDGRLFILNPETLHRGTNEELRKSLKKIRQLLRDLRP